MTYILQKKGGSAMNNMQKVQPEYSEPVEVEIKGYGCDDDCQQYFEKTVSLNCGWKDTDNTIPIW